MKKELDFSRAMPNKFAGRKLTIIGDRHAKARQANGGGRLYLVTLPERGDVIEIAANSKKAARLEVLRRFNKTRLPNGTTIALAAVA